MSKYNASPLSGPRKDERDATIAQAVEMTRRSKADYGVWTDYAVWMDGQRGSFHISQAPHAPWKSTIAVAHAPKGHLSYKPYGERDPDSRRGGSPAEQRDSLVVHRKAYTRANGTRVKASTFRVKDRGRPGKTPKSQQFYHPRVKMGWRKDQPAGVRIDEALRSHKGNSLAAARALQALANVTTDKRTKQLAKSDANYLFGYGRSFGKPRRDPATKVRFTPAAPGFSKLRRELGLTGNAMWHLPKPSPWIIYWNGPGARLLYGSNKPGSRLSPIEFPGADDNYYTLKEATKAATRFWRG